MHGCFGVFLFVLHVSAFRWNNQAFAYIGGIGNAADMNYRRFVNEPCKLCLGPQDCFGFSSEACELYSETTKILKKNDEFKDDKSNPKLRADVDSMVYDIIETAITEDLIQECIPFISKYTDCTKDNICLGCKTCECNERGLWNCTVTEECRPDLIQIVANKRTLFNVIEVINKMTAAVARNKRSVQHSIRSLEDMDLENDMNENNNYYEDKLFERDNEEQSLKIEPAVIETKYYDNTRYAIPTTTEKHEKKPKQLVKLIVNSLINDALPSIFDSNSFDIESNRVKRWVENNETANLNSNHIQEAPQMSDSDKNTLQNKITFDEISEWLNEIHPHFHMEKLSGAIVDMNDSYNPTTGQENLEFTNKDMRKGADTVTSAGIHPEYIAFEEVFGTMHFDNKTYVRRKLPLEHASQYTESDINIYDDKYYEDTTPGGNFLSANNATVVTADTAVITENSFTEDFTEYFFQSPTKVVVDLLKTANKDSDIEKENSRLSNNTKDDMYNIDDQINSINVMKRDVVSVNKQKKTNFNDNIINSTENNILSSNSIKININDTNFNYLKDGVLAPLDNILRNKNSEIIELLEIKERLIKFIESNPDNMHINRYNLNLNKSEYVPKSDSESFNFRRSNLTMIDKYKIKLKRDIYEVIRDVVGIRKLYSQDMKFPAELNFLIRSLKHYIHKTGFHLKNKEVIMRNNDGGTRRTSYTNSFQSSSKVKNVILNTFDLLLKNIRSSDALQFISPHSRRIIQRLINKYYVDDFAGTGLRIYDPHYNMTNDLSKIGSQWQEMSFVSNTCPIYNKLHVLKRLHLTIAVDAEKINDALALIKFARGRRMVPADETKGEIIAMNINKNLNAVKRMFESEFKQTTHIVDINSEETNEKKHKKKNSFMNQIRRLLKKSKKNIAKLLRRNVPKTEIVKEIARKDVEEMTKKKLQATMEKWQTNLNIIPRVKRSDANYGKRNRRIANILPKYLRGKVHPGITKNEKTNLEHKELKKKGSIKKTNSSMDVIKKPYSAKLKNKKSKNVTASFAKHSAATQKHLKKRVHLKINGDQKSKKEYAAHDKTDNVKLLKKYNTNTRSTKKRIPGRRATTKATNLKRTKITISTIHPLLKHKNTIKAHKNLVKSNRRVFKTHAPKTPITTKTYSSKNSKFSNIITKAAVKETTIVPVTDKRKTATKVDYKTNYMNTANIETTTFSATTAKHINSTRHENKIAPISKGMSALIPDSTVSYTVKKTRHRKKTSNKKLLKRKT